MDVLLKNREEAGYLLSRQLIEYRSSNAVVVGIPRGGVGVASAVANNLDLPLELMAYRRLKHPADASRSIGSITEDEVIIEDCSPTVPQDFIYHQILALRNSISLEKERCYSSTRPGTFRYRTVLLIDDILVNSDDVIVCLRSIKRQNPLKVIVAIPVVGSDAARTVGVEADDIRFIRMEAAIKSPFEYFVSFPKLDDDKVTELFQASRKNVNAY